MLLINLARRARVAAFFLAASLPIDADAGFRSLGDVGPGLAELVYLKVRERDYWKDVRPPSRPLPEDERAEVAAIAAGWSM